MTSKLTKLQAEKRTVTGKKVKNLRKEGIIPANIFGKGVESLSIQVKATEFKDVYKQVGETGIVEVTIGKVTRPVLVNGMHTHPVTDEILHIDLRQVDLKAKITANVPVELTGEAPAEKEGLGIMVQQLDEVEVEALPLDLPESFEINVENLKTLEDSIKVSDLKIAGDVEILTDSERIVANISEIRKEEEPAPVEATDEEEASTEAEASGDKEADEKKEEPSEESK